MTPLISVIVPVYNVEKYIKHCTESLINQDYTSAGGVDATVAILNAVDRLRDILTAEVAAAVRRRITQDQDRFIDRGAPELQRLIEHGDRELVRAVIEEHPCRLDRAVSVSICFYYP